MTIAIIYDSITGNTYKLAKCIYDEFKEQNVKKNVKIYNDYSDEILNADIVFVGSYTKNMEPSDKIKKIYKNLTDKKIFIFGTCSYGFGEDYYSSILQKTAAYIPGSNEVLDYFYCQGKMPYSNRVLYETKLKKNKNDAKALEMIDNFDRSLKHPNFDDYIDLQIKIKMVLNGLKKQDEKN